MKSRGIQWLGSTIVLLETVLLCLMNCGVVHADGSFSNSAHGNPAYGVSRSTATCENWPGGQCVTGSCAHCHDTFDPNICGDEVNHPNMLFGSPLYTQQNIGFCFECHKLPSTSVQVNMPNQRSYSFKFGGGTDGCPGNIKQAFNFVKENGNSRPDICGSDTGSAHHLTSIRDFLQGRWGFGDVLANINPCEGCHDKHIAQRHYYPVGSDGTSPIYLPSTHDSTREIWGDQVTERMENYAGLLTYQAPAYYGGGYEPEGNATNDGSNVPDYVTFCTDCHNNSNTIYSNQLGRNLYQFDWATEKHGRGAASDGSGSSDVRSPYLDTECGSYVLSCTDCHESHGSQNIFLIRQEVNYFQPSVPGGRGDWTNLCQACHVDRGHDNPGDPHYKILQQGYCTVCHDMMSSVYRPCTNCHYHGGTFTTPAGTYKTF